MRQSKKGWNGFSIAAAAFLIIIGAFSCGAQASDKPKVQKITKYTTVDYFDVNYPKTIKVNSTEYSYVNDNIKWVHELYHKRNFAVVRNQISGLLSKSDERSSYMLTGLYSALSTITDDKHIDLMHNVLDEWCSRDPKSHIPWLVRGVFYVQWAWSIRGTAYAKDVPEQAWPVFRKKLEVAKKDLIKSFELNPKDPNSSWALLPVSRAMGYPENVREQYYQNGVKACPGHLGVHLGKLEGLKSKWGGSEEKMFTFAKSCLERSKQYPLLGLVMAEAYQEQWRETDEKENTLGKDLVWAQLEGIYNAIFDRYPDILYIHFAYASKAFNAKKYDIALKQFEFIGDRWMDWTWWKSLDTYNSHRGFAYHSIGYDLLFVKHRYKESISYLETAIHYKPQHYDYYALGEAYTVLSRYPQGTSLLLKAEDAYRKAVELDPNNWKAKRGIARIKAMSRPHKPLEEQ